MGERNLVDTTPTVVRIDAEGNRSDTFTAQKGRVFCGPLAILIHQLRSARNFAMTRSMIDAEMFFGNSNELLSVTIFMVLRLASYSTWLARHWDRCNSSSLRASEDT